MHKLLIVAAAALGLVACQPQPRDPSTILPSPQVAETAGAVQVGNGVEITMESPITRATTRVVLEGYRALALAEIAYNTAAQAAITAVDAGIIRGSTATVVRELNRQATRALELGKAATDVAEKARQATAVFNLVDRIRAFAAGRTQ